MDDSGSLSLTRGGPFFVGACALVEETDHRNLENIITENVVNQFVPPAKRLSFVFRASKVFHHKEDVAGWQEDRCQNLLNSLAQVVVNSGIPIVYGAVNKPKLKARYVRPINPHVITATGGASLLAHEACGVPSGALKLLQGTHQPPPAQPVLGLA